MVEFRNWIFLDLDFWISISEIGFLDLDFLDLDSLERI